MSVSKEMIELADELAECGAYPMAGLPGALKFIAGFALTEAKRDMIVAALRASAVAEPVAWLSIAQNHYGLWRERPEFGEGDGFTVQPLYAHPAPAAPVLASVREALEKIAKMCRPHASNEQFDGAILTIVEQALASLPAPEAAPTREEIAKAAFNLVEAVECSVDLDLHPLLKKRVDATKSSLKSAPAK